MNKIKYILGNLLLGTDDFFARHHIYFNLFVSLILYGSVTQSQTNTAIATITINVNIFVMI